ncbi:hypothetical protein LT493_08210 [Streptomyces tricolor]|nr:hypothetical protein [Streptomyces tricolor]
MSTPFLSVRDLKVHFSTEDGIVKAVDGLSFDLEKGQDPRHRRRVGLRQVRHQHGDPGPARPAQHRPRRRDPARRQGS